MARPASCNFVLALTSRHESSHCEGNSVMFPRRDRGLPPVYPKNGQASINLISAALRKIGCSNFSVELDNFQVSSKSMIMVVRVYVFKVRKIIL